MEDKDPLEGQFANLDYLEQLYQEFQKHSQSSILHGRTFLKVLQKSFLSRSAAAALPSISARKGHPFN